MEASATIYLDANIFLNADLDPGSRGEAASRILEAVNNKSLEAVTSVVTLDEIVWVVKKFRGNDDAVLAGQAFLDISNLLVVDLTREMLADVLHVIKHSGLSPKDAIHYATMRQRGLSEIITEDSDFDSLEHVKRFTIADAIKKFRL